MPLNGFAGQVISIHVPREGHDLATTEAEYNPIISIHVPREGHDRTMTTIFRLAKQFQSTCPARGTTGTAYPVLWTGSMNFNPRAPRGARRLVSPPPISTLGFQSTCPARGTTGCAAEWVCRSSYFNPRAPRGARPCDDGSGIQSDNFNPRAPRGARPYHDNYLSFGETISIHVPREGHDC